MAADRVIYDLGSNNGDDIAYYLRKADRVVAVEANPVLASGIGDRFHAEVAGGRLVVAPFVITGPDSEPEVEFYIHGKNHVLSQFARPEDHRVAEFACVRLPAIDLPTLFRDHGAPHYVKIDLEGMDVTALRGIFEAGIRPDYISAEAHTSDVFAHLVAVGGYRAFKLVDGKSVPLRYGTARIAVDGGTAVHAFPPHSAGPYGNDIHGPWMTSDALFRTLAIDGLGWKDIHASRVDEPDPRYSPPVRLAVSY